MSITEYVILIVTAAIGIILGRYLGIHRKMKKTKKTYEKTAKVENKNTPANPYNEIISLLNKNKVEYQIFKHEPVYTSKQAAQIRGDDIKNGVKSLLFKADDDFVLVVIPANKRVSEKKLKELLRVEKVKLAFPEEVKKVMGCEIGACYPIGNIIPVKTLIDKSIREKETISFNPGVHNKTIMMTTKDYFGLAKGEVVDTSQEDAS